LVRVVQGCDGHGYRVGPVGRIEHVRAAAQHGKVRVAADARDCDSYVADGWFGESHGEDGVAAFGHGKQSRAYEDRLLADGDGHAQAPQHGLRKGVVKLVRYFAVEQGDLVVTVVRGVPVSSGRGSRIGG